MLKSIRYSFLSYLGGGKGTGRLLYQYYSRANLYARVPRLFRHYFLRSYVYDFRPPHRRFTLDGRSALHATLWRGAMLGPAFRSAFYPSLLL
ncbi:MAG: hypothetical protein JXA30_04760 [Deltaproteobacteria bacterium]|nr:hypothetical protein [Deltaproteobacteria bacterium]